MVYLRLRLRSPVSPQGDRGGSLDLFELVNALKQRNLGLPLLIRFFESRFRLLSTCLQEAIIDKMPFLLYKV